MTDAPVLPAPGERPILGVHRDPLAERTSPAGRPETEAMREARFRRELAAWARKLPPEERPEQEEER